MRKAEDYNPSKPFLARLMPELQSIVAGKLRMRIIAGEVAGLGVELQGDRERSGRGTGSRVAGAQGVELQGHRE